jgi:competence/damage-inducible protein CinA-like protein
MPSAEIISIGTEILLGEIVDTNTRYIARSLRGMGVDLYRTITIGDNVERIAEAIRASMAHAEIVITTGGLGPTVDDPTREAVARAFETKTEYREQLWEQILEVINRYGRRPSENQKRQAYVPQGALTIPNTVGTAPAFIMQTDCCCVISLPGVPKEMEHMWHELVVPYLRTRYNLRQIIKVRLIHTAGAPEAEIDERIGEFEQLTNPTVGLAAHSGIVDVRITAKASTEAEADAMIKEVEGQIRERLGKWVFGADEDTLEQVALRTAANRDWNLVIVESGLDGALTRRLANSGSGNLLLVEQAELGEGKLHAHLDKIREQQDAHAALGLAAFPQHKKVELALITPETTKKRTAAFGGHPGLLARWAVNNALNWLRRIAEEEK